MNVTSLPAFSCARDNGIIWCKNHFDLMVVMALALVIVARRDGLDIKVR